MKGTLASKMQHEVKLVIKFDFIRRSKEAQDLQLTKRERDCDTLKAGSSQHGKHRLASAGSNCVTAIFFFSPLCSYVLESKITT